MADTLRDQILTSPSGQHMIDRVSPIYDDSYVALWMFQAIGLEYDKLWYIARTLPDQLFPETATWAIELWEQRYGIAPQESWTLEERRKRIIAARSIPKPFTPAILERYIYNLTGRAAVVDEHTGPYSFHVTIVSQEGELPLNLNEVERWIKSHKPSHMSYTFSCQCEAKVSIHAETCYWRFDYLFCGTLPQMNITSGLGDPGILADHSGTGYSIQYPMCGVRAAGSLS